MYLMPLMSTRSVLMLRLNVLHVVGYESVGLELSATYIGYYASHKEIHFPVFQTFHAEL